MDEISVIVREEHRQMRDLLGPAPSSGQAAGQLLAVDMVNLVLAVAGIACVITGIVAAFRSRHAPRGASPGPR